MFQSNDPMAFAERKGFARGLREACNVFETIATEIMNPPQEPDTETV